MNVRQFASVALVFLFLGTILFWNPVVAEEVTGQEKDINLYLYSENGVGKLHTKEFHILMKFLDCIIQV